MKNLFRISSILCILLVLAFSCQKKDEYVDVKPPIAAFKANSTTITAGATVNFTDQSTNNPTSWSWIFGDGGTSTLQNPSHTYTMAGIYSVTLTVANSVGSNPQTKTDYITVNHAGIAPVAAFTASSTTITTSGTVNFTDQSTNSPTSWSWSFGDGGVSTLQNPSHTYKTVGNFTVKFTAMNCFGTDPETKKNYITVNQISGTFTDIDGNVYNSVTIGDQIWMKENLKTTKYSNNDPITNITGDAAWTSQTAGAYCWYNNDISNKITYGALYNYYAVEDSRNLCPTGWHIPSDTEWTTLTNYLGGDSIAGGKMKATTLWGKPNTSANNSSGFSAFLGGYRFGFHGNYGQIDNVGYWWAVTVSNAMNACYRFLYYQDTNIYSSYYSKRYGFSVRCLKDN